jgi:CubicO group peptidase (beta-lactamase class C family)
VYPTAAGHSLKAPGSNEHKVCRTYLLSRNVAPAGGIISDAGDLLGFAAFFMGDGTWNGRQVLSPDSLQAMLTPQVRAPKYAAAGFSEWGGLGWAIRFIDGVKVIEHGGSLSGFEVKLKLVPARRFALAILTNSGRGGILGDRVAEWALDHVLGLRAPKPEPISLPDNALALFTGDYRSIEGEEEVTLTLADSGLRCVVKVTEPTGNREQAYPPTLLKPLSQREFVVVTPDENAGSQVDFIVGDGGTVRFLRMDGRLYDPVKEQERG